jgi:hypothetical protein
MNAANSQRKVPIIISRIPHFITCIYIKEFDALLLFFFSFTNASITVSPQYNEPYILADQTFVISNFVNAIMNYLV